MLRVKPTKKRRKIKKYWNRYMRWMGVVKSYSDSMEHILEARHRQMRWAMEGAIQEKIVNPEAMRTFGGQVEPPRFVFKSPNT